MVGWIIIGAIFLGPAIISGIYNFIKDEFDKERRARQQEEYERQTAEKDELAQQMIAEAGITNEVVDSYQKGLSLLHYSVQKFKQKTPTEWKSTSKVKGLKLGICPRCKEGWQRVAEGPYGKFLGCSRYPECDYTEDIKKAKEAYKVKSHDDLWKDLKKAYL